jgi:phage-related protein
MTVKYGTVAIHVVASLSLAATVIEEALQVLGYTGTLADGDRLVIDCDAMTVTHNGVNVLDHLTGGFFNLHTGDTKLAYNDSVGSRTLALTVDVTPRWL